MVLDPVTAFGVAGNVIQFVEFGSNIVSKARQIKANGQLLEISKLEEFTTVLDDLNSRLQNYPPSSTVSTGPGWEIGILQASEGCQKVSAKLSKLLEKMKTLREKRFGALRQAFSAEIKDKEINTLMRDLEAAKSQLSLNIVAYISAQRETDLKEVLRVSKSAETTFLEVVRKDYYDLRSQLDLLKDVVHGESSATQQAINEWQSTYETMLATTSAKIADDTRQSLTSYAVRKMLASLYFVQSKDRQTMILDAHRTTFDWIFDDDFSCDSSGLTFTEWLKEKQSQKGLFYVRGKPGSGKSCFMRYLAEHPKMPAHLQEWARESHF